MKAYPLLQKNTRLNLVKIWSSCRALKTLKARCFQLYCSDALNALISNYKYIVRDTVYLPYCWWKKSCTSWYDSISHNFQGIIQASQSVPQPAVDPRPSATGPETHKAPTSPAQCRTWSQDGTIHAFQAKHPNHPWVDPRSLTRPPYPQEECT